MSRIALFMICCDRKTKREGNTLTKEKIKKEMALGGKYKEFFDVQSQYYRDGGKENEEEN